MRLKIIEASLAAILAALSAASVGFARLRYAQEPQQEPTVSAAISLKDVLDKVAQLYRVERSDTVIHFNLAASGTL
jgi:ABC-type molybdate transport system substrate-binding protein